MFIFRNIGSGSQRTETKKNLRRVSMFHRVFFDSIIDKHQHMHLTFNSILV